MPRRRRRRSLDSCHTLHRVPSLHAGRLPQPWEPLHKPHRRSSPPIFPRHTLCPRATCVATATTPTEGQQGVGGAAVGLADGGAVWLRVVTKRVAKLSMDEAKGQKRKKRWMQRVRSGGL
ncbi:hypothetical protein E2C01_087497 [Portunus trituberculatus]|uniref:Uncharacterized protein n=1 Tax=Portunus trituberculatus TaxID=210409 RepID=A0A5B7JBX5_PORTR|nr:hypothetical protein [Portunus trituberculatus]